MHLASPFHSSSGISRWSEWLRNRFFKTEYYLNYYLFMQMIHNNQIKMRKILHHSLPMLYLSLPILGKLHWKQLPRYLMCGREDSLSLACSAAADFDPMLGPHEDKPDRVGRDRQVGMPTLTCSTTDLFQVAGIFLLTLFVIILFSLCKIEVFLHWPTEQQKTTWIGKGVPLFFI